MTAFTPPPATRPACPFLGATVWTIDPVLKRITEALAALGMTSGGIARRLAAMKCFGERGNCHYCPVLAYLRRQKVGNFVLTMLGGGWLEVAARDGWVEAVKVPPQVEWFQTRFDRGEFPACASPDSAAGGDPGVVRPDWDALHAAEGAGAGLAAAA